MNPFHKAVRVVLTLSQTTNFRPFRTERVCRWQFKFVENWRQFFIWIKTLWEEEKLLVMSNFSFSHSVFKRLVLQTRKNQGLFGKGITDYQTANFKPGPNWKKLQTTFQSAFKVKNKCHIGRKTLCEKEKLLVTGNFSFSHHVFRSCMSFVRQNAALSGNGLNCTTLLIVTKCSWEYSLCYSPRFLNLKVKQSLIGQTMQILHSQSEVTLPVLLILENSGKWITENVLQNCWLIDWLVFIALYHTIMTFNTSVEEAFWKHCEKRRKCWLWEKEKMLVTSIFSFAHSVFFPSLNKFQFFSHIYFVVCQYFQFEPI